MYGDVMLLMMMMMRRRRRRRSTALMMIKTIAWFTLQKVFWHSCQKRAQENFVYTTTFLLYVPKIPYQNFWAHVTSLGDMRSSI